MNNKFERLLSIAIDNISYDDTVFIRSCLTDSGYEIRSTAASMILNSPYSDENDIELLYKMCDDEEALVRIEVYDALSCCSEKYVADKIKSAIISEDNCVSRNYAIICWTDVTAKITQDYAQEIEFIKSIQKSKLICTDHCRLSCYYALYRFGEAGSLESMLDFLNSNDYHIQCAVVNFLSCSVKSQDIPTVNSELERVLKTSPVRAVAETIKNFLNKYCI
ncbi:MAG: hypothetical protein E7508_02770 [Ruminococcus sp.]|nr:hypothetical protein [Ruminococcus sp.]